VVGYDSKNRQNQAALGHHIRGHPLLLREMMLIVVQLHLGRALQLGSTESESSLQSLLVASWSSLSTRLQVRVTHHM
jgi:hypothetical protein